MATNLKHSTPKPGLEIKPANTFLLIEDDQFDIEMVQNELVTTLPHVQLRVVADEIEAKQYLVGRGKYADRNRFPAPNVILLDLQLPSGDGVGFLQWLRSEACGWHRFLPVIIVSGSGLPKYAEQAYDLGANGYVMKLDAKRFRESIAALGTFWTAHAEDTKPTQDKLSNVLPARLPDQKAGRTGSPKESVSGSIDLSVTIPPNVAVSA
jgi:CheY-like chemotaxis protein